MMNDIRPSTFYHILYYLFTALTIIGMMVIGRDVFMVLVGGGTSLLTINFWPPYNIITIPILGVFTCVSYHIAKKYKKLYKGTKWR